MRDIKQDNHSEAATRLRRAADAMRAGRPISSEDALPLADAIDGALAGKTDLDTALGLVAPSPFSPQALARRSSLLLQLAEHYRGTPSACAKAIAADAQRYSSTCWARCRDSGVPPPHHRGKPEAILFQLHADYEAGGAKWPLCTKTIWSCLQSDDLRLQTFLPQNAD